VEYDDAEELAALDTHDVWGDLDVDVCPKPTLSLRDRGYGVGGLKETGRS
jgi:hypothetical protein